MLCKARLADGRPNNDALSWRRKWKIALGCCRGVAFLHAQRPPIIHRDLKSLNVLVDSDYNAKVTDFGLCRAANSGETTGALGLMTTGQGTFRWMAPELCSAILKRQDSVEASTPVDTWGLGLILLEIATHTIPFPDINFDSKARGGAWT